MTKEEINLQFKGLLSLNKWVKVTRKGMLPYVGKVVDYSINFEDNLMELIIAADGTYTKECVPITRDPSNTECSIEIVFTDEPTKYKQEYEYKSFCYIPICEFEVMLNTYSKEGWRVIHTSHDAKTDNWHIVFERKIK